MRFFIIFRINDLLTKIIVIMKTHTSLNRILIIMILPIYCLISSSIFSQIIPIGTTFTSDDQICPFESYNTIYGLTISGKVTLSSDTSLVRLILLDKNGNEWMVYEAYPMILPGKHSVVSHAADETRFLQVDQPDCLEIDIIDAQFDLDTIFLTTEYQENLESDQLAHKEVLESMKIDSINAYIEDRDWQWNANKTCISQMSYVRKKSMFGNKYNLIGIDYYSGGVFMSCRIVDPSGDESNLVLSFDWRKKHDAHLDTSMYWDGNLDRHWTGSSWEHEVNGWMTAITNQAPSQGCSVFSSVAAFEALINLYFNNHLDSTYKINLSERQVYNCTHYNTQYFGCDTTKPKSLDEVTDFFVTVGVIPERCYPWRTPYCDGIWGDCDDNDSLFAICESHDTVLFITDTIRHYLNSQTNKAAYLKVNLIEKGPLICRINDLLTPYSDSIDNHAMCLVGFETDPQTGAINWILKNSWGYNWGDEGYLISPLNLDQNIHYRLYALETPVYTAPENLFHRYILDKDKDGYYNWGIGENPGNLPCSDYEDSNDNDKRTGPYDTNYNSIPIMPEIVVTHGIIFNADTINNGDFYYRSMDTSHDTTVEFYISNPGSAQLNLAQYNMTDYGVVTIEYQDPAAYFDTVYLPGKSICMEGDTTSFQIKVLAGATPGSLVHLHIHLSEPDLYPDSTFEFTLVLNGCETSPDYDSVKTEITWADSCRSQHRDLHIKDGGQLTIIGTVLFSPEADVIIEPGGKLVVNGGKLTKSCGDELWNGIQVWGDSSLSQYPDTNQGFLDIKRNGCIEYAHTGCFAGKILQGDTLYEGSGGIVKAEDGIFLNNEVDAEFLPFINDNPYHGSEMDNFSNFMNCLFKTYDPLLVLSKPNAHVILDGVKGVDFYSCTFRNQDVPGHAFDDNDKGTGILVFDSKISVKGKCLDVIYPCENYDSSYFENLRYGIRAFNTGGNRYFSVSETVFDSNIAGIYLSGYHQPEITSCRFYSCLDNRQIPGLENAFYGGLYLDGSTGYHIENNCFLGPYHVVPDSGSIAKIGIYVKDSGEDNNEIYNNSFIGIDAGIIAEGINKGENTGLCLKCNDFRTCLNDMLVVEDSNYRRGRYVGIKENQGADDTLSSSLAGNTFTAQVQNIKAKDFGSNHKYYWSYFNDSDHISYYHHAYDATYTTFPSDSNITKETVHLHNQQIPFEKEEACPSSLNNNHYKGYSDPRLEFSEANSQLLPLQNSYNTSLDGGNTYELDFEIITSFPEEALELRQQLLTDSPYLSDTILKQAIYKENVLPNAMIRDVLAANPQAAKSQGILEAVDGRYDPMPDYMMADIMQGLDQIGALESLESKIGYWEQYRSRALSRLIREYLTDSTIIDSKDSLINLFQNESSLQSKYRLAFTYCENNQPGEAMDALDDILTTFELTARELEIHQDYLIYIDILQMMKDSNLCAHNLDSASVQSLITIMNNDLPLINAYARGLLLRGRHIDYNESVAFPAVVKAYPAYYHIDPQKFYFPEEDHLVLFPNPSGDYVIAYFNSLDFGEKGSIVIDNLQGQRMNMIELDSEQNQVIIDLSNFSNGIYFISLLINSKKIESEKLIKTSH